MLSAACIETNGARQRWSLWDQLIRLPVRSVQEIAPTSPVLELPAANKGGPFQMETEPMSEKARVSRAVLEARKAFKPTQPATTDREENQRAFDANRERLKSERLAREAAEVARKRE